MTRQQFGAIISRAVSLFFIVRALDIMVGHLPVLFRKMSAPAMSSPMTASNDMLTANAQIMSGACVVLALLFWFGAKHIGRALAGREADAPVSAAPPENYLAAAFALGGCWVLAQAVPEASQLLAYAFSEPGRYRVLPFQLIQKSLSVGIYVTIAALFIFGARGLGRLVTRVRAAG
jgi:hypothetical protein